MNLLLDAHALIWAVDELSKLGDDAAAAIQDPSNNLLVSAGTIWEIAIKVGLDKLSLSMPFGYWMHQAMSDLELAVLPITVEPASAYARLPRHHGDPFDRLLIAQATVEALDLVSHDGKFDDYGISRLW